MTGIVIASAAVAAVPIAGGGGGGGGGGGPGDAPVVTVTPATIVVRKPGGGTATFTFTGHITGGLPPYRLLWNEGSGDRTQLVTTFSKHAPADDSVDGFAILTVTDAADKVGTGQGEWIANGF